MLAAFFASVYYFPIIKCRSFSGNADSNQSCARMSVFGVDMDHVVVDMEEVLALNKIKSAEKLSLYSINSSEEEEILNTSEGPSSYIGGPCMTCYQRNQFSRAGRREHNTKHQRNNPYNARVKALNALPPDVKYLAWAVQNEKVLINEERQNEVSPYSA